MFKSWISMWKNAFNYTGTATRKDYWLALIMNVIVMYIGAIPCGLIAKFAVPNTAVVVSVYLVAIHIPVFSLYFRRARDAGWKIGTAIYLAVTIPVISGLAAGIISDCRAVSKIYSVFGKVFALAFALFFYGMVLGFALYGNFAAIPALPIAGLLLGAGALIVYVICNWKEFIAILLGRNNN